jgi:hypothetical protein
MKISFRILVNMVMINIEKGIMPQPAGLMDMEVQTYAWHFPNLSGQYVPVDFDNLFRGIFPADAAQLIT